MESVELVLYIISKLDKLHIGAMDLFIHNGTQFPTGKTIFGCKMIYSVYLSVNIIVP